MLTSDELKERAIEIIDRLQTENRTDVDVESFIKEIQTAMAADPESRPELGPLLGKLRSLNKTKSADGSPDVEMIQWVDVSGGALSIGHRPKRQHIKHMRAMGVTHIFTLLSEKEGAEKIGNITNNAGLQWLWLPLVSANPPGEELREKIREVFEQCRDALERGGKIYIHCSAGIHRTGMITYTLLRSLGFDAEQAMSLLSQMRELTGREAGEHRIAWGDQFVKNNLPFVTGKQKTPKENP